MAKGPFKAHYRHCPGGLIPAALVARELEIRLIDTICAASYESSDDDSAQTQRKKCASLKRIEHDGEGYLLIDDLVDTGNTARVIRQLLPAGVFCHAVRRRWGVRWWICA